MKIEFTAQALKSLKAIVHPNIWRRLRNRWIDIKDFCWNRWSTVKPRRLGNGWVDRDHLLIHVMFEVLCQFVEKEMPKANIKEARDANWRPRIPTYAKDFDDDEIQAELEYQIDRRKYDVELLALYDWWMKEYPTYSEADGPYVSYERASEEYKKITEMAIRLVNIREVMWT